MLLQVPHPASRDLRYLGEKTSTHIMISGISAATSGLRSAFARFDRAAAAVSENTDLGSDGGIPATGVSPATGDLAGAMVDMLTAQLGVRASLEAVRGANDMLAEAIDLGGYTPRD